ncbi:hypothetical protein GCM10022204_29580 [Microlunatus aurantiacus]|uniref:Uncharacterized protein n=1 Tax=Microlunatus aurantiacus TaxID=446786 RepID=A0ABP7DST0_9ACTN
MTDTKTLTPSAQEPAEPKPRLLELSATQLVGGALAAMTAAVIGARLGVAGTVFGAAIGSVVAGTAGSLYTASLKHTRNRLSSAFVGRVGGTAVAVTSVPADTTAVGTGATEARPVDLRAAGDGAADGWGDWTVTQPAAAIAPPSPQPEATAADVDAAGRPVARRPWKAILISIAAVFLLAVAGITAFELVSGQAVSGGQGTTLTQVGEGRSGGTDTPVQAPSAETSSSPTAEPSTTASAEPSVAPSSQPTGSAEPTTEPSQSAEPSTSTQPSSAATPSASSSGAAEPGDTGNGAGG